MHRVMALAALRHRDGRPTDVRWPPERPLHHVRVARVLDDWDYVGRWWDVEVRRRYLLLEGDDGHLVEVFEEGGAWWVSRASA